MTDTRTSIQRDIEAFQHELNKLFARPNEDPCYSSKKSLEDAISDNPRFFPADRKVELAEILFSILDLVYERCGSENDPETFCNPLLPGSDSGRLPEFEMLLRCIMPLPWAIHTAWVFPEMQHVLDDFTASFSQQQGNLVSRILDFLFDLFPCQETQKAICDDVRSYWHELSKSPELFHAETDEEKSRLLPVLLQMAKKHRLIYDGERP